jgi:hypothetical protein
MWNSVLLTSKFCGKGGKNSFIVFPRLSIGRQFHARLGRQRTEGAPLARVFSHAVLNSAGLA